MKSTFYLTASVLALLPSIALAQWSAGIATIIPSSPYDGVDANARVIPFVAYEGERLSWRGPSLQYKLSGLNRGDAGWQIGVQLAPNQLDTDDSNALAGIEDRNFSILAGATYSLPVAYGNFQLSAQTDISGQHDGQRLTVSFDRNLISHPQRKWAVSAGFELEYLTDNYTNYYFGVSSIESIRTDYAVYTLDAAIQPSATISGYYAFNSKWRVLFNTRVQSLASDIKNSPIVDSNTAINGFIGAVYSF